MDDSPKDPKTAELPKLNYLIGSVLVSAEQACY